MELVSCPEDELGWQRIAPVGEPWQGRKFLLGTHRHICCLFLPQGWLWLPRYVPEDAGQEAPGLSSRWQPPGAVGAACRQLFQRLSQMVGAIGLQGTEEELL